MLPAAIIRRLTLTIIYAPFMAMSLFLATLPHAAFAQTSSPAVSVTVERVFTADTNGSKKTFFAPGDAIQYAALCNNPSGEPTTVKVGIGSEGPAEQNPTVIYTNMLNVTLPPGQSSVSAQSIIPQGAMTGTYAVIAVVDVSESSATSVFTVTHSAQTPPPVVSITVERVFITDTNGSEKTFFAPGDAIQYVAVCNNSSGEPTTVKVEIGSEGPAEQNPTVIYENMLNVTLPPGQSSVSAQSIIPQGAMTGTYAVVAVVNVSESSATSVFTVT